MKLKYGEPDAGFSLIEIIVSITVLAIAMTAIYQGLTDAITKNYEARDLQKATFEAESVLETLQAEGIAVENQTDAHNTADKKEKIKSLFLDQKNLTVTINSESLLLDKNDTTIVVGGYYEVNIEKKRDDGTNMFSLLTNIPIVQKEVG